jgi:hypothetical protein
MTKQPNGRTNGATGERILVAVRDVGQEDRGQGSLIDSIERAERIVAALVEAGVEPEAVAALRARELPLKVSYRWDVEIFDKEDARPRGRPTAPQANEDARGGPLKGAIELLREVTPESPFELRLDRVVWVGLWAVSLLILGLSIITSLSRGAAREFVVEVPPTSFEGEFRGPNSTAGAEVSPVVDDVFRVPECAAGGLSDCQCQDFATQGEAQAFFETYPPRPGHVIDPDGDGVVCEWLPVGTPLPGQR